MKLQLFFISFIVVTISSSAQMSYSGESLIISNMDASANCLINSGLPNNGGIMNLDQSTFETMQLTKNGLILTSKSTIDESGIPAWFQIHSVVPGEIGDGSDDTCVKLFTLNKGVDLTNNTLIGLKIFSNISPSTIELFLGGEGEWSPSTSTFSKGLIASIEISEANKLDNFLVNYGVDYLFNIKEIDPVKWENFTGKNKIQSVGYRSATPNAVFNVDFVYLGYEYPLFTNNIVAKSLNVYPNPASNVLTVEVDAVAASSVELVDLSGKLVASQSVGAGFNKVQFNVANVNAGLYFLSIRSANGVVSQKVIVK